MTDNTSHEVGREDTGVDPAPVNLEQVDTQDANPAGHEHSMIAPSEATTLEESPKNLSRQGPKEVVWGDGRKPDPTRICSAHRTNGEPCRKTAVRGTEPPLCMSHGAAAPAVRRKARVRLELAADRMAKELLGIASADDAPPAVKLAAIRDALDRAGLSSKTAVEIEVGPTKEFESILTAALEGGSRAESRARRGEDDDPAVVEMDWVRDELEIVDVEVVEDGVEHAAALHPRPEPSLPPQPLPESSSGGLMPMEDALDQLRATAPPPAPQARRRRGR